MLSCNFFSSTSKVLSSAPPPTPPDATVELLERFAFFQLALYLEPPLEDFVLSVELELERDDSEMERDGCLGEASLLDKASVASASVFSSALLEHFAIFAFGTLSFCNA